MDQTQMIVGARRYKALPRSVQRRYQQAALQRDPNVGALPLYVPLGLGGIALAGLLYYLYSGGQAPPPVEPSVPAPTPRPAPTTIPFVSPSSPGSPEPNVPVGEDQFGAPAAPLPEGSFLQEIPGSSEGPALNAFDPGFADRISRPALEQEQQLETQALSDAKSFADSLLSTSGLRLGNLITTGTRKPTDSRSRSSRTPTHPWTPWRDNVLNVSRRSIRSYSPPTRSTSTGAQVLVGAINRYKAMPRSARRRFEQRALAANPNVGVLPLYVPLGLGGVALAGLLYYLHQYKGSLQATQDKLLQTAHSTASVPDPSKSPERQAQEMARLAEIQTRSDAVTKSLIQELAASIPKADLQAHLERDIETLQDLNKLSSDGPFAAGTSVVTIDPLSPKFTRPDVLSPLAVEDPAFDTGELGPLVFLIVEDNGPWDQMGFTHVRVNAGHTGFVETKNLISKGAFDASRA